VIFLYFPFFRGGFRGPSFLCPLCRYALRAPLALARAPYVRRSLGLPFVAVGISFFFDFFRLCGLVFFSSPVLLVFVFYSRIFLSPGFMSVEPRPDLRTFRFSCVRTMFDLEGRRRSFFFVGPTISRFAVDLVLNQRGPSPATFRALVGGEARRVMPRRRLVSHLPACRLPGALPSSSFFSLFKPSDSTKTTKQHKEYFPS